MPSSCAIEPNCRDSRENEAVNLPRCLERLSAFEQIVVVDSGSSDADDLLQKRENAFRYAHAHLGQAVLAERWVDALRAI